MSPNSGATRVQFVLPWTFLTADNTGCIYCRISEFRSKNLSNCRSYLSSFLSSSTVKICKDLHCWALCRVKIRGIIFFLTQTFIKMLVTLEMSPFFPMYMLRKFFCGSFFWWNQLPPQGTSCTHLFLLLLSCMLGQYLFAFPDLCTWE